MHDAWARRMPQILSYPEDADAKAALQRAETRLAVKSGLAAGAGH